MPGDESAPRADRDEAQGPGPGPGEEPNGDNGPETDEVESGWRCDLCGGEMMELHCKLICTRCGYERDCSDP